MSHKPGRRPRRSKPAPVLMNPGKMIQRLPVSDATLWPQIGLAVTLHASVDDAGVRSPNRGERRLGTGADESLKRFGGIGEILGEGPPALRGDRRPVLGLRPIAEGAGKLMEVRAQTGDLLAVAVSARGVAKEVADGEDLALKFGHQRTGRSDCNPTNWGFREDSRPACQHDQKADGRGNQPFAQGRGHEGGLTAMTRPGRWAEAPNARAERSQRRLASRSRLTRPRCGRRRGRWCRSS